MKLLLLIAFTVLYVSSSAQQSFQVDVPKVMKQSDVFRKLNRKSVSGDTVIKKFKNYLSMKQNPGIHYLPQDNMPCLVPDTKDIAAIPNAWSNPKVPFKGTMPNPGLQDKPLVPQSKDKSK